MQHRDFIIINKIVDELNVVIDAVGEMSFDEFDSH